MRDLLAKWLKMVAQEKYDGLAETCRGLVVERDHLLQKREDDYLHYCEIRERQEAESRHLKAQLGEVLDLQARAATLAPAAPLYLCGDCPRKPVDKLTNLRK